MKEDAELLRSYAGEKSETAFAELVERHVNFVYAGALRRVGGDAHLAEDVTQQVFTSLAQGAGALARHPVLSGWLYTTTRNVSAQVVRTETRRRAREQEAYIMNELTSSAGPEPEWERLQPALDHAMDELAERDREAVLLRFAEARTFAEVGAKLRLTENAARMRVERALEKMRGLLAQRGVTSSAAALGVALGASSGIAAPVGLAATVTGTALAGAAGITGAAGTLTFMSMSKLTVGLAAAAAVAGIGFGVYQANARREAEVRIVAAHGERDELARRTQTLERQIADAPVATGASRTVVPPAENLPVVPKTGAAAAPSSLDYLMAHPEMRPIFREQEALRFRGRFDRFFRNAGLSSEQQEQFIRQQVEFAEVRLDRLEVTRSLPEPERGIAGEQLDKQIAAERDAALRQALSPEAFQHYAAYARTLAERGSVDQLASHLYYTDVPLTAGQSEQLVQILSQDRYTARTAATATVGGAPLSFRNFADARSYAVGQNADFPALVTDAAIERAQGVLSPVQLAALRQMQARQLAQIKLSPPRGG